MQEILDLNVPSEEKINVWAEPRDSLQLKQHCKVPYQQVVKLKLLIWWKDEHLVSSTSKSMKQFKK